MRTRSATRLTEILASYGRFHRDARNRLTHYFGVPAIIYAVLVPLALRITTASGAEIRLDRFLVVVAALGYISIDPAFGLSFAVVLGVLAAAAEATCTLGFSIAVSVASSVFVLGWALQLLGHRLEGNRPALLTNLAQVLVAPLFLMAELGFALGLRRDLRAAVERELGAARGQPSTE